MEPHITTNAISATDWTLCVICQESSKEKVVCPGESKRHDGGVGYKTFGSDLEQLHAIGGLPTSLKIERLNEGDGLENTFTKHNAVWHKSCRDKYNKTKLNRLEKRKLEEPCISAPPSGIHKRSRHSSSEPESTNSESTCFFCGKPDKSEKLRNASTLGLDSNIYSAALFLEDTDLLAKLSPGDIIAIEVKYHCVCLTALYNRVRSHIREQSAEEREYDLYNSIAFAEMVIYVEDELNDMTIPVLKLVDLVKMYELRLSQLNGQPKQNVHATRFKDRLLAHIPGLQAHTKGRCVLLVRDKDIGHLLTEVSQLSNDSVAINLARTAQLVRLNMFDDKLFHFDGSFPTSCQEKSVPTELITLIRMLIDGAKFDEIEDCPVRPEVLTIAQLIQHNSVKQRRRKSPTSSLYHRRSRETPLPLYIGMMIHAHTRKRGLIDKLFELGMSASYDRVLQLSADLANSVCEHYEENNVVVPPSCRTGVFTTSAVDNIDYNPSSTTATGSFHGTGISLFQHPDFTGQGIDDNNVSINPSTGSSKSIRPLPDFYTHVPPVSKPPKNPPVPAPILDSTANDSTLSHEQYIQEECDWLEAVRNINYEVPDESQDISWSAYHASRQTANVSAVGSSTLLPLFQESAHSVSMIRHAMTIVMNAIHYLNPGQTPVIACDQPLYALAKTIQWTWPDLFGEDKIVTMFGGLHIEMAAWKAAGTLLEGSGWTDVLTQAEVATAGKADSYLHASHLTRTRNAHQVTAACMHIMQHKAYDKYISSLETEDLANCLTFELWCQEMSQKFPLFKYWSLVVELELTVLMFVRSLRTSNFQMFMEILTQLMPWMFALDRTNYARWLSVHVRDMQQLAVQHPELSSEFEAGKFTYHKTQRAFSAMPLDQSHEQNNEMVKSDGSAIGLTENPQALRRWMTGGPQIGSLVNQFETSQHVTSPTDLKHHEQKPGKQTKFKTQVQSMVDTVTELGNPFSCENDDLVSLCSKVVANESVTKSVREMKETGSQQYSKFVTERLVEQSKPIGDPIQHNKFPLFKDRHRPDASQKPKNKLKSVKTDCNLFSTLYIGCQNREGNLDEFFKHENQACPPSISNNGKLRHGVKSDMLHCLEKVHTAGTDKPSATTIIIDGAAVVHMLPPGTTSTFKEYSEQVFEPYITRELQCVQRLDLVWDVYRKPSLKAAVREKRGIGCRRKVVASGPIPRNWSEFLHEDENKTELFRFLSEHLATTRCPEGKEVVITTGQNVICIHNREDVSSLSPCSHEEADTRIFIHCKDAASNGHSEIMIRTVDTDVVVLATAFYRMLGIDKLWIAFGPTKNLRYLAAHGYASALGPEKYMALPMLHAITGCDTVSSFAGCGKKTGWDVAMSHNDVIDVLSQLTTSPGDPSDDQMAVLERFVVLLYDRGSELKKVNDSRKHLFTKKRRTMERIPPTRAVLVQHVRRAIYQGGYVWGECTAPMPTLPDPVDWGWTLDGENYQPLWTTLPEAAKSCQELIRCGCIQGCTGRCSCVKAGLQCNARCACDGLCTRM